MRWLLKLLAQFKSWDGVTYDHSIAKSVAPIAANNLKKIQDKKVTPRLLKNTLLWDEEGRTYDYKGKYFKASLEKGGAKENRKPIGAVLAKDVTVKNFTVVNRKGYSHDGIHIGNKKGQWSNKDARNFKLLDSAIPQGEDTVTYTNGSNGSKLERCILSSDQTSHGSQKDKHLQVNFGKNLTVKDCYISGESLNGMEVKGSTSGKVINTIFHNIRTVFQYDGTDDYRNLKPGKSNWDLSGARVIGSNKEVVSKKGSIVLNMPSQSKEAVV